MLSPRHQSFRLTKSKRQLRAQDTVQDWLMQFNQHDGLSVHRSLQGGVLVLGDPGSGKSSLLKLMALRMMRMNASLVIFSYKENESKTYQHIAQLAGRQAHVYRPFESAPWNPLLDLQNRSHGQFGLTEKLTESIMTLIRKLSENSGGDAKVWSEITAEAVHAAVTIAVMANEPVSYAWVHKFLQSLPHSEQETHSAQWRASNPICQMIERAQQGTLTISQQTQLDHAARWVFQEAALMSEKMRKSISITAMSGLSPFVRGDAAVLNAEHNTWSSKEFIVDQPGVLIVHCPIAIYGDIASAIQSQIKASVVDALKQRDMSSSSHPIYLIMDEWPSLVDRHDHTVIATLRDKRAALVCGAQCVDQIIRACSGDSRTPQEAANSLLNLFGVRFFLSSNSPSTLRYAQEIMSSSPKLSLSFGSSEQNRSGSNNNSGGSGRSLQLSEGIQPETPAYQITRLKRGGPEYGYQLEAFVTINGLTFKGSDEKASLKVRFDQLRL